MQFNTNKLLQYTLSQFGEGTFLVS